MADRSSLTPPMVRSTSVLRVSVLELPARWAEPAEALREVDELLALGPTDLAIVPEMSFVGYVSPQGSFDPTRFAEPIDGPTVSAVRGLCERHGVHLVAPLVLREGDCMYNALVAVAPDGAVLGTYKKRHPWFPERWATPGKEPPPMLEIGELKVTTAICFDGHFLEYDAAELLSRADLLVFTSAWVDEEESRMPLLRGLARTFGMSVANANWGRGVVELPGQGGSCVLDGRGGVLALVPEGKRRADASVGRRASRRP
jgi:predicted amidohydrolase